MHRLEVKDIKPVVKQALEEDIGKGDITTEAIVEPRRWAKAYIELKEKGVVAGLPVAREVFFMLDKKVHFRPKVQEGIKARAGIVIAEVEGSAKAILEGERVALNFLQRLSGIATAARQFEDLVYVHNVDVLDTRKTTPGLRVLEKYAVKLGGGENHRFGLFDAILIKDNHIKVAGSITAAVQKVAAKYKGKYPIQIEISRLEELKEIFALEGINKILLDNMNPGQIRQAVKMVKEAKSSLEIEVSGGINEKNIVSYAKCGINYISIGALTHSVRSLDLSLKVVDVK